MKCMDVLELMTNISEDLTIEDLKKKSEILTKTIRKDIFYGLVVYDPVRFTGINKICMNQLIWGGISTRQFIFKHCSNHFRYQVLGFTFEEVDVTRLEASWAILKAKDNIKKLIMLALKERILDAFGSHEDPTLVMFAFAAAEFRHRIILK